NAPGRTRVRSRPTDGFSAMTNVLPMSPGRVAQSPSTATRPGADRAGGVGELVANDVVRYGVAAARAGGGRGEDRRHDAAGAVDHRAARVARAHDAAQGGDPAPDRAATVGVLG